MIRRHTKSLITQIEEAALSGKAPLPDALRLCVALGGKAGSHQLREWAMRELRGYQGRDIPVYRRVTAPICIDGVRGNPIIGMATITGQRISPQQLPDVVAEHISEEVEIGGPISEIDELSRRE